MKTTLFLCILFFTIQLSAQEDKSVFNFKPSQSMCMTGKGAGQDAVVNPYRNENSIAVVQNLGENTFSVRIEYQGKLFLTRDIKGAETAEISLRQGSVLYIDSKEEATAKVTFKQRKS